MTTLQELTPKPLFTSAIHTIVRDLINRLLLLFSQAYRRNIRYPTHLFVTYMYTWYSAPDWWLLGDHSCTPENRASVMEYALGPIQFEFITNYSAVADTGIVSHKSQYWTMQVY